MARSPTYREIRRALADCLGRCLDDADDTVAVARRLAKLSKPRCEACDHLKEVHGSDGCLGGPETACGCHGWKST